MSSEKQADRPEAIIPCAGLSSRMGDWKPMLAYRGSTIVEHAVRNALAVCRRVLLVTGYRSPELEALFAPNTRVRCVRNEAYERGMFSSIRAAAGELSADRFFVAMGDMPEIPPRLYLRLLHEPPAEVLRPRYRGVPAHPVLFSAKAVPIIRSLPPEASMAQVLAALEVREIETEESGSIKDIDTREEYDPSGISR
jgi:molybdenum cofactor cytidylyltransferase